MLESVTREESAGREEAAMPCTAIDHRYVYRRTENLTAGTIYHFFMRNMRDVYVLQAFGADSIMYLVDNTNRIVARNDDYDGRSSEIIYRPDKTGVYTLIIRSYNYFTPG